MASCFRLPAVEMRGQPVRLRSQLHLVHPDATTKWIHVAYTGEFKGHRQGPFTLTAEKFDEAIRNFENQTNAIALTFEHPINDGSGRPIRKAGWIHKLMRRGEHLFALAEFTDYATSLNRDGSYKFCSIVFELESEDRKTAEPIGMEIFEIGMTDDPFIDGLQPIMLSRPRRKIIPLTRVQRTEKKMATRHKRRPVALAVDLDAVIASLNLLEGDPEAERVLAVVEAELKKQEALSGPAAAPDMPAEDAAPAEASADSTADAVALADEPAEDMPSEESQPTDDALAGEALAAAQAVADAAGMDLSAALAALREMADQVAALLGGAPEDGTSAEQPPDGVSGLARELAMTRKQLARQLARNDALEAEHEKRRAAERKALANARVDKLIADGRLLDEDRADWADMAEHDPKRFERLAKTLARKVPTGRLTGNGSGQIEQGVTAEDDPETAAARRVLEGAGIKGERQNYHLNRLRAKPPIGEA